MESFRLQQIPLDLIGWKALQNLDACQVLVQPEKTIFIAKWCNQDLCDLWPFQSLVFIPEHKSSNQTIYVMSWLKRKVECSFSYIFFREIPLGANITWHIYCLAIAAKKFGKHKKLQGVGNKIPICIHKLPPSQKGLLSKHCITFQE